MKKDLIKLPTEPTNLIFTGVAGTGKTHKLLEIQKLYDETVDTSWRDWRLQQIKHYGWCDAVCAVLLLEDRMMTVPEIMQHKIIKDKAYVNNRTDNINQTLWVQLNKHAHPDSKTVNSTQRSANYYFDKTESSHWYILDEVKLSLTHQLSELLSCYDGRSEQQFSQSHTVSRSCLVSFHQSYGYDEFVEGIRPKINPNTGQMQYEIQQGAFLDLCNKAINDPEHRYAMLIDEINRANTAQVFGELMSVIEPSKRALGETPMSVRLAYSGRQFKVPSNLDIYATMNTQDHSLAHLDMAFRRRFEFITCYPDSTLLGTVLDSDDQVVNLADMMNAFNVRLLSHLGAEAQLGHAFFMNINNISELAKRLYRQIIPQIIEFIKLISMPNQTTEMLSQILYGLSLDQIKGRVDSPIVDVALENNNFGKGKVNSIDTVNSNSIGKIGHLNHKFIAFADSTAMDTDLLNKMSPRLNSRSIPDVTIPAETLTNKTLTNETQTNKTLTNETLTNETLINKTRAEEKQIYYDSDATTIDSVSDSNADVENKYNFARPYQQLYEF